MEVLKIGTKPIDIFFRNAGVPATGLSAKISIYKRGTPATPVTDLGNVDMIESGGGWYTYETNLADGQHFYVADGSATITDDDERYHSGFIGS